MALLRRSLFALALGLGLSCASPTLPLPPPAVPSITTGSAPDTVKLSSTQGAQPNAVIIVINENTSLPRDQRVSGTIADEAGSWAVEVPAKSGDILDISQETGSARSPSTTISVK